MSSEMYSKMRQNPKFQELVKRRTRFAVTLSVIVLVAVYVRRANGEFDDLTKEIVKDAQAELAHQTRGVA